MPHSGLYPIELIHARLEDVPKLYLVLLEEPAQRERAQIRHLDHRGKTAVNEQRRLHNVRDRPVKRPLLVELPAQRVDPRGDLGVVVMDYDSGLSDSSTYRMYILDPPAAIKNASGAEPKGSEGVAPRLRL
jgi:hypothetical protein